MKHKEEYGHASKKNAYFSLIFSFLLIALPFMLHGMAAVVTEQLATNVAMHGSVSTVSLSVYFYEQ